MPSATVAIARLPRRESSCRAAGAAGRRSAAGSNAARGCGSPRPTAMTAISVEQDESRRRVEGAAPASGLQHQPAEDRADGRAHAEPGLRPRDGRGTFGRRMGLRHERQPAAHQRGAGGALQRARGEERAQPSRLGEGDGGGRDGEQGRGERAARAEPQRERAGERSEEELRRVLRREDERERERAAAGGQQVRQHGHEHEEEEHVVAERHADSDSGASSDCGVGLRGCDERWTGRRGWKCDGCVALRNAGAAQRRDDGDGAHSAAHCRQFRSTTARPRLRFFSGRPPTRRLNAE